MSKDLSVKEIAEHFGVSDVTVYRWLRAGLPHKIERVIGRKPKALITTKDVTDFLNLGKR